jgi:hypothetical protein
VALLYNAGGPFACRNCYGFLDDGGPQIRVKVNGVVFDPNTGDIRSNDTKGLLEYWRHHAAGQGRSHPRRVTSLTTRGRDGYAGS